MSVYAVLDGDPEGGDQVASNRGWGDFVGWVGGLASAKYPQVVHLADYGWSQELPALETQLSAALKSSPPADADTREVAAGLLAVVKGRGGAGVLTITNGLGKGG